MQKHPATGTRQTDGEEPSVAEIVSNFSGKSQSELFGALREATDAERAAGNLDNTRMDEIYAQLSPYLTDAQREKMQLVLSRLKE